MTTHWTIRYDEQGEPVEVIDPMTASPDMIGLQGILLLVARLARADRDKWWEAREAEQASQFGMALAQAAVNRDSQWRAWIEEERERFAQLYPACGRMLDRLLARVEKPQRHPAEIVQEALDRLRARVEGK